MAERTALVTGASRGIGRAIALRLAKDGYNIIATCRSKIELLDELEAEISQFDRDCRKLQFDISDRDAVNLALEPLADNPPDVVVLNAGLSMDNLFVFMSANEWDRVLRVNLDGFYNIIRPLIFGMIARKSGRVVAISSISGQMGQAGQVNYSATKAGIIGAVKALAREVGRKGILVNAVSPGIIETEMTKDLPKEQILPLIPLARFGKSEEVAGAVSFLCGEDSSYIQGQVISVNGGMHMSG